MSPFLIAVLGAIEAAGHDVADVRRIDQAGESTTVAIAWAEEDGILTLYDQGWNTPEEVLAWELLEELVRRREGAT